MRYVVRTCRFVYIKIELIFGRFLPLNYPGGRHVKLRVLTSPPTLVIQSTDIWESKV
jgi:hypothetical protein